MLTIWRHWAQTEGAQQLALEDTGKVFKNKEHQKGTNRNNVPQWWRGGKSTYLRNEHSKFTEQRNHSIWEKTAEIEAKHQASKPGSPHKFGLAHRYHELAGWIPPGWQPKPSKLLPLQFHPPAAPHEAAGPPLDIEKKQTSTTGFAHLAAVHLAYMSSITRFAIAWQQECNMWHGIALISEKFKVFMARSASEKWMKLT